VTLVGRADNRPNAIRPTVIRPNQNQGAWGMKGNVLPKGIRDFVVLLD